MIMKVVIVGLQSTVNAARVGDSRCDSGGVLCFRTGVCYENQSDYVLFSPPVGSAGSLVTTTSESVAEGTHKPDKGGAARHGHARARS